eukprot:1161066-Pelagomonas_calceolata.AAC.8
MKHTPRTKQKPLRSTPPDNAAKSLYGGMQPDKQSLGAFAWLRKAHGPFCSHIYAVFGGVCTRATKHPAQGAGEMLLRPGACEHSSVRRSPDQGVKGGTYTKETMQPARLELLCPGACKHSSSDWFGHRHPFPSAKLPI